MPSDPQTTRPTRCPCGADDREHSMTPECYNTETPVSFDWQGHTQALADAIQLFRNDPLLRKAGKLRATAGYTAMCDAWADYKDSGGPVLTWEQINGR